jgi:hypothetical protein
MNEQLLTDALTLLAAQNQHGHSVMWQTACRNVIERAHAADVMPALGNLGILLKLRQISIE